MNQKEILLNHGSGGKLSQDLFKSVFGKYFGNPILDKLTDSAIVESPGTHLAFTTDSYVVDPIFFPGGNIGTLAVCGTVNDLSVAGAEPIMLSTGFIIEEGFPLSKLEEVVSEMAAKAKEAGVSIVTGDTKVVNKGKCDGLFINTSGIGRVDQARKHISYGETISPGDVILINGTLGDHGMAILSKRNEINLHTKIASDCAPLNGIIQDVLAVSDKVRFMRDATRGGLATVLCECVTNREYGIRIDESTLPLRESVMGMCDMLGFDPLYIANEGKVVMIVAPEDAQRVLETMQQHPYGKEAAIVGEVVADHPGKVTLQTEIGGKRIVEIPAGDQLPRIC